VALAAADEADTKAHSEEIQWSSFPVEDPEVTNVPINTASGPNDPNKCIAGSNNIPHKIMNCHKLTQILCHTRDDRIRCKARDLTIEAGKRNECRALPITHMQFELLICGVESKNRTWREFRMFKQTGLNGKERSRMVALRPHLFNASLFGYVSQFDAIPS